MPVDINRLTEGWLELESDPGLFTLLLEDFGVKGVQVEEIYDLQKPIDGPVYGFIFLFRWIEERRSRRKVVDQSEIYVKDEEVVNSIFFAQQMVPNSCATHSLLSVLLNCPDIHLGETLTRLKGHTAGMNPENKGWAIGNTPELAKAHNSHAMPQAKRRLDRTTSITTGRYTGEAYHFVSYVPINGRLFELDGLKPYPMDHGPWGQEQNDADGEGEDWTEKFRKVIADRLGEKYNDIRFNLMAVVPDKRLAISHKLAMLKTNRQIVLEALQQLVRLNHPDLTADPNSTSSAPSSAGEDCKQTVKRKAGDDSNIATSIEDALDLATPTKVSKDKKEPCRTQTEEANGCGELVPPITNSGGATLLAPARPPTDYSQPLTIQTSPAPSTSSTDTSSEVGSAFNSPTQHGWASWSSSSQGSPNSIQARDLKKFVVIRVAMDKGASSAAGSGDGSGPALPAPGKGTASSGGRSRRGEVRKVCLEAGEGLPKGWDRGTTPAPQPAASVPNSGQGGQVQTQGQGHSPLAQSQHTFAPKDLLALLKNLEGEISLCEGNLRDENEKRKKYKVDDCRRTHNYDEFICTFLSMLAQQGKLADLVQQHHLSHHDHHDPHHHLSTHHSSHHQRPRQSRRTQRPAKCRKRK